MPHFSDRQHRRHYKRLSVALGGQQYQHVYIVALNHTYKRRIRQVRAALHSKAYFVVEDYSVTLQCFRQYCAENPHDNQWESLLVPVPEIDRTFGLAVPTKRSASPSPPTNAGRRFLRYWCSTVCTPTQSSPSSASSPGRSPRSGSPPSRGNRPGSSISRRRGRTCSRHWAFHPQLTLHCRTARKSLPRRPYSSTRSGSCPSLVPSRCDWPISLATN